MELYFGIKLVCGAIIVGLFMLAFLWLFVKSLLTSTKEKSIEKYLRSIGYRRELISTASVGDNHTYGYVRKNDKGWADVIRDSELRRMSLRQVKDKYKD